MNGQQLSLFQRETRPEKLEDAIDDDKHSQRDYHVEDNGHGSREGHPVCDAVCHYEVGVDRQQQESEDYSTKRNAGFRFGWFADDFSHKQSQKLLEPFSF